ncbi:MAG: DUF2147 domain-containing protein [Bacteroidota bacterium]
MKKLLVIVYSCLFLIQTQAQNKSEANKILGLWQTGSGKGRIQISAYGDKFGGKLVWLKEPLDEKGNPKMDIKNPDEAKRKNPKIGINNLLGFTYEGKGKYENGTIYDPENGKIYKCVMTLENDSILKVRGYIGITMVGRTDVWKRIK